MSALQSGHRSGHSRRQLLANAAIAASQPLRPFCLFGGSSSPITSVARARRLEGEQVEIIFSDNGQGMAAEVLQHAFDPFFTTCRSQGHVGLGLFIVHNIVTQQLGGRIKLTSAPASGTTFRMTIPVTAPGNEGR